MNLTPWSGSNFRTALSSPSLPMATSSERSSPWPWYFFTYEITNRRLAVTSRSAATSSPERARRARRFSSSGSVIIGSFWMSRRYWSNAPEGLERRNARAFPGRTWAIVNPDEGCSDASDVGADQNGWREGANIRFPWKAVKQKTYPHHKILTGKRFLTFSTPAPTDVIKWVSERHLSSCKRSS